MSDKMTDTDDVKVTVNIPKEKPKPAPLVYVCCCYCKRYKIDWVDKNHYKPLTLFNVVLVNGEKAKACQDHVHLYKRGK